MGFWVLPLLQVITPVQLLAVKVANSVPHTCVLLGVTTGAFGVGVVVITTLFDATLVPHVVVHVA